MSQTVDFAEIKDQPYEEYDHLAEEIERLWRKASGLNEGDTRSRRLSLAITALEEAMMWTDREWRLRGGKEKVDAS